MKAIKVLAVIFFILSIINVPNAISSLHGQTMENSPKQKKELQTLYTISAKDEEGNLLISETDCTYVESSRTEICFKKDKIMHTVSLPQDRIIIIETTKYEK